MDTSPATVMARLVARHPRASEERIAALTVLHYEILLGRPVRPAVPSGAPFQDEPGEAWLRELKAVAGSEYDVVRQLLKDNRARGT